MADFHEQQERSTRRLAALDASARLAASISIVLTVFVWGAHRFKPAFLSHEATDQLLGIASFLTAYVGIVMGVEARASKRAREAAISVSRAQ